MVAQGFHDSFAMFYDGFIGAVGFGKGLGLLACQRVLVFCQHSLIDRSTSRLQYPRIEDFKCKLQSGSLNKS